MKKLLKILLVLILVLLLGLGIAWLTWNRQWPWWVGLALFLGVLSLWVGFVLLRVYLRRRRERAFVHRVLNQDMGAMEDAHKVERQRLQDLQERWTQSLERLRSSRLRRWGSPVYALPWFIVIGGPGAGKSSCLRAAGLHSILGEVQRAGRQESTRNCDWWTFNRAILLDTAGRYSMPVDGAPDLEEWERFLTLLTRQRRREPLNGIIVVVAADRLMNAGESRLDEDGQELRRRVDHLMGAMGARLPVYVLVSKLDLVPGMTGFVDALGDRVTEPMGYTNAVSNPYYKEVLRDAMASLNARLAEQRFVLAHTHPDLDPEALLFPGTFAGLEAELEHVLHPLFAENAYQETPVFRGIFFGSARSLEGASPEPPEAGPLPARRVGSFLREFFASVLPRDRHLHRPLREFLRWRQLTRHMGLLTWTFAWMGLMGLMGASFVQNMRVMGRYRSHFQGTMFLGDEVGQNLLQIDRVRLDLIALKRSNRNWWIPRFGMTQSLEMQERLEIQWLDLFRERFLRPVEKHFNDRTTSLGPRSADGDVADCAGYLVTRIALLRRSVEGAGLDAEDPPPELEDFRQATGNLIAQLYPTVSQEAAQLFADAYLAHLAYPWREAQRVQKQRELQLQLQRLMERRNGSLNWLVQKWIPGTINVELADFWGEPESAFGPKPVIAGAYTREGRRRVEAFLELTRQAMLEDSCLERARKPFWDWYEGQAQAAWHAFAERFDEGRKGILTNQGYRREATLMCTSRNPYFRFLQTMAQESEAFQGQGDGWTGLLQRLDRVRLMAEQEEQGKQGGMQGAVSRLKGEQTKLMQQWEGKLDARQAQEFELLLGASKLWKDYLSGLKGAVPVVLSREACHRQMAAAFQEKEPSGEGAQQDAGSIFFKSYSIVLEMESLLGTEEADPMLWNLVKGPHRFLMEYCLEEAGMQLQEKWKEQVLSPVQGLEGEPLSRALFQKGEGLVWKFLEGPAKPFISAGTSGYMPRRSFTGQYLQLSEGFLVFLRQGRELPLTLPKSSTVAIGTVPTELNKGARVMPKGTRLSMRGADQNRTTLENWNYPQNATFTWYPDASGDVELEVHFQDFTLSRAWRGRMAFAHFLADFESGSKVFSVVEFPEHERELRAAGVVWIRVNYRIQGAQEVLCFLRRPPVVVPRDILASAEE